MWMRSPADAVPTPFPRRVAWLRRRLLPIAVWGAAIVAAGALLGRDSATLDATGLVRLREIPLSPVVDARVQSIAVELFDEVKAGQVVVLLDDRVTRAELAAAQAEQARLSEEVNAERERLSSEMAALEREALDDQRRFALAEATAHLDLLDRDLQQKVDTASLQSLATLIQRQEMLVGEQLLEQSVLNETRVQYEALQAQVRESIAAREAAAASFEQAKALREARAPDVVLAREELVLAPLHAAVIAQQALIEVLQAEVDSLVLTSPVDGRVANIWCEPGATATPGVPVVTITADQADQVVAYVPDRMARSVTVGTPVRIVTRRTPRHVAEAKVVKVNSQIAQYPLQLQPNPAPTMAQWGLPLIIGPVSKDFLPGEVVYVRFLSEKRGIWGLLSH